MAKCVKCGKKGLFLKVNDDRICSDCVHKARLDEKDKYIQNLVKSIMPEQLNVIELNSQIDKLNAEITDKEKELSSLKIQVNLTNEKVNKLKSETQYINPKKSKICLIVSLCITVLLITICLICCTTPITYNSNYYIKTNNSYDSSQYVFKRNNICYIYSGNKIKRQYQYFIQDNIIYIDNEAVFEIVNHNNLISYNTTYKNDMIGESFLIAILIISILISIVLLTKYFIENKQITEINKITKKE